MLIAPNKSNQLGNVPIGQSPRKQSVEPKKFDKTIKEITSKEVSSNEIKSEQAKEKEIVSPEGNQSNKDDSVENKKNTGFVQKHGIVEESQPEKGNTEVLENIEETIATMMMENFKLTPEELEGIMKQMNITPMQLLDQNVFREFLMQLSVQNSASPLLENALVKDISKLWDQLEQMKTRVELVAPTLFKDSELALNAQETEQQINVNESLFQNDKMDNNFQEATTVPKEVLEVNATSVAKPIINDEKQLENVEMRLDGNGASTSEGDIMLQMPVQGIETNIQTKMWQTSSQTILHNTANIVNDVDTQILKNIAFHELKQGKEIVMELNPKELGKLALKITEQNGIVTANIRVETEKTKEMLLQNMEQLKEGLVKQGLSIGNFQVDVRKDPHQSEMYKQRQKSSRRIEELIAKHLDDVEEVAEIAKPTAKTETEIDYMA